ncbi:hypothetical protein IL306_003805 [Fusarium sp. DS 682]|nr:hypothetical protein IL306_003805 [Fusarium sp. DS 682]
MARPLSTRERMRHTRVIRQRKKDAKAKETQQAEGGDAGDAGGENSQDVPPREKPTAKGWTLKRSIALQLAPSPKVTVHSFRAACYVMRNKGEATFLRPKRRFRRKVTTAKKRKNPSPGNAPNKRQPRQKPAAKKRKQHHRQEKEVVYHPIPSEDDDDNISNLSVDDMQIKWEKVKNEGGSDEGDVLRQSDLKQEKSDEAFHFSGEEGSGLEADFGQITID